MIKNIILDMGNVLLDYNPHVILEKVLDNEEERQLIYQELFLGDEWVQGDLGYITNEQRYEGVRKRVPEYLHDKLKACVDGWNICMIPLDGAKEFCEYCKNRGYGIYVLSNASSDFYNYFFKHFEPDFFDGIVISSDVHIVKPDVAIYQYLLGTYGLLPEECLFIDDRANNVEGALACGMHAYQFQDDFEKIKQNYHL